MDNRSLFSLLNCGQPDESFAPSATRVAKTMQVGEPHSLQFVLGSSFNISIIEGRPTPE